jgi:hypothetical protein
MHRARSVGCLLAILGLGALAGVSAAATVARPNPCRAGATRISFGSTGLDASHVNAYLVLTNATRASCTLAGAPRVRFISRRGAPLGNPSRPSAPSAAPVTLAAGDAAHALLRTSIPGVWPPATCRPTMAWGVLVAAPGSTSWTRLHFPLSICAGGRVHESTAAPVAPGLGPTPGPCTAAQLAVALGPSQGAAGTTYVPLVFTNPVLYTCTLRGFPRVLSVRGPANRAVGPPATDVRGHALAVWVQPFGGTASASFGVTDAGDLPASSCGPRRASGVEVTPPHTRQATLLADNHVVCTRLASTSVSAVVAGRTG